MLTDTTLRNLKPRSTHYKVSDRDGMYALVSLTGVISFRYDYRLNGRRETLVIGRYSSRGLTLALAREKCLEARKAVERDESPVQVSGGEKRIAPRRPRPFAPTPKIGSEKPTWPIALRR